MEHPNAHALGPAAPASGYTRPLGLARATWVIAGCAAVALVATPLLSRAVGTGTTDQLRPVDPAAEQVTALGPHVVVYSVPTKKGKGGGSTHHKKSGGDSGDSDSGKGSDDSGSSASGGSSSSGDSGDSKGSGSSSSSGSGDSNSSNDSGSSSDSGSSGSGGSSVSNTVNGSEVGGAQTYNNHTTSNGDPSTSASPVQLKDNTGAGVAGSNSLNSLNSQGTDGTDGTDGATGLAGLATTDGRSGAVNAAPAVMLMRVSCPASVASGTVCLQVTSVGGARAASLPTDSSAASLPLDTTTNPSTMGLSKTSPATTLSTGSPTSALGQAVGGGGHVDVSAMESQSGKKIELTGYSFQDNQGGNNAKISCPIIHKQAGGTGTYQDPITVASGGKSGGASADGIKCGDRFYLPAVQRYVIVEDTGNTPNKSMPHLDMYVGDDPNKSCMNKISGTVTAIPHPPSGLPVLAGPIGSNGSCKLPGSSGGGK